MTRRAALAGIVLATLLITAAYGSAFLPGGAPAWAPWALAMGTALVLVAAMVLGAARADRGVGRLAVPFAAVFAILAGGFAYALVLPPPAAGDALFLGLPAGAAVVLLGIGLVPLFILPVAYALTFEEMTLSEADLARIREQARALAAAASVAASSPSAPSSVDLSTAALPHAAPAPVETAR